jgi:transposase-like protein
VTAEVLAAYSFVWMDALTQKAREGGRTVNVHVLIATGVNADGHREILGIEVTSADDGAGWLAFPRRLHPRVPPVAATAGPQVGLPLRSLA